MTVPDRVLTGYALVQLGDAVACAAQIPFITEALDRVECPPAVRKALPPIKAASGIGLLLGRRNPTIARVTGIALTGYFALAIGSHLRVRDSVANTAPAVGFAALSAWVAVGSRSDA